MASTCTEQGNNPWRKRSIERRGSTDHRWKEVDRVFHKTMHL
jgi:hypothetical protein